MKSAAKMDNDGKQPAKIPVAAAVLLLLLAVCALGALFMLSRAKLSPRATVIASIAARVLL